MLARNAATSTMVRPLSRRNAAFRPPSVVPPQALDHFNATAISCSLAAASGSAVFNATGKRVRNLPITLDKPL